MEDNGSPRPLLMALLSLGLGLLVGSPLSVLAYRLRKRPARPLDALHSRKWTMLQNWTGYLDKDQFGWSQPPLSEVVGANGRTKLAGLERPHDYQVSVSFPGPDFGKGLEGCYTTLTDSDARPFASSGTEMAEALQHWITRGWLNGDERRGLDHIFVCSKNLRYCPGGVKATNFRLSDILESSNTAASSTAILNENWALYLRESFLEARVVIFVVNKDWIDSVPCNQEFEALVLRKRWLHQHRTAIVFIDITDDKFNQRWGSKLPQLKGTMVHEAQKYFDVYSYTYNMQVSTAQKRTVEQDILKVVSAYGKRHPPRHSKQYQDLTAFMPTVNWPNWLFFGALEGTNGWRPLLEIRESIPKIYDLHTPVWRSVQVPFPSRRFRLRVMGVADNTFTEGFKFMCRPLQLLDMATGQNIVAPGKGFWKTPGERLHCEHVHGGSLGFSHWCGPKQYSWLEWLVPNKHPAASVSMVDVRVNAQHWVLEALPEEVWPSHSKAFLRRYKFFGFDDPMDSTISAAAAREPRWVPLHHVDSSLGTGSSYTLSSPACAAFRLRILETPRDGASSSARCTAASLQIQANFPEGLYPLSGGIVTGSGGNPLLEDAPPEFAFDGDAQNRWVDINGGGIGNTSWLAYEHPEPVTVKEYTLTTHEYALASYHSHMTGAPRDWTLQALAVGTQEWVEVDRRSQQIFSAHRQTKKYEVAKPVLATKYKLEFTAVGAGCASSSIQVGDVELLAPFPPRTAPLTQPQLVVLPSAYNSVDAEQAASSGMYLSGDYGVSWAEADQLDLCIPTHDAWKTADSPEPLLGAVQGGRLGWVQGDGRVTQWYDHPMEIDVHPKVQEQDLDKPLTSRAMLVDRPRKEPELVDHVYVARFRRAYPDRECELMYSHNRPLCIKAYSFHSCKLYNRGDPRSWSLEAETEPGLWVQLHSVTNFHFPDRGAPALFFLPENTVRAARYRWIMTEMKGMVTLLHVSDVMLYAPVANDRPADLVPVCRQEVAHATLKLRAHHAPAGLVRPCGYTLTPHRLPDLGGAFPKAWVLEGLTPDW